MCLEVVNFALTYDEKTKEFCGVGFKKLNTDIYLDSLGRFNKSLNKSLNFRFNTWYFAQYDFGHYIEEKFNDKLYPISSSTNDDYFPGFHIFLNKEHAISYPYLCGSVVMVQFKNVIGFGQNIYHKSSTGPCVISEQIKILKVIKE